MLSTLQSKRRILKGRAAPRLVRSQPVRMRRSLKPLDDGWKREEGARTWLKLRRTGSLRAPNPHEGSALGRRLWMPIAGACWEPNESTTTGFLGYGARSYCTGIPIAVCLQLRGIALKSPELSTVSPMPEEERELI